MVRPIVGVPKSPTRKISELIAILLKPFLKHVKSYIRGSIDFLNNVTEILMETQLLTLDVVGLHKHTSHFWTGSS